METTVELSFRRRYQLAPSDPRFLSVTVDAMLIDHWANYYADRRAAGKPDCSLTT